MAVGNSQNKSICICFIGLSGPSWFLEFLIIIVCLIIILWITIKYPFLKMVHMQCTSRLECIGIELKFGVSCRLSALACCCCCVALCWMCVDSVAVVVSSVRNSVSFCCQLESSSESYHLNINCHVLLLQTLLRSENWCNCLERELFLDQLTIRLPYKR